MKVASFVEYDPGEAGEFVGERDGGLVVSSSLLEFERPAPEAIGFLLALGGPEDGSGTVDEQRSQVRIAPLGDASEPADVSARVLLGCEAEETRKVPSGGKALDVTDEGDQCGCGQQSDAWNGTQMGNRLVLPGECLELAFGRADLLFEASDLIACFEEAYAQTLERAGIRVV